MHAENTYHTPFTPSKKRATVGAEIELQIIDPLTGKSLPLAPKILKHIEGSDAHSFKSRDIIDPSYSGNKRLAQRLRSELMENTVEIVTGICNNASEVKSDFKESLNLLKEISLSEFGIEYISAGAHPFERAITQRITDGPRYLKAVEQMRHIARSSSLMALHVHVGVDKANRAMPIHGALHALGGFLLALSASSPFWDGVSNGYASNRALMFQQVPVAGLGYQFDTWDEYCACVDDYFKTGVIESQDELRWDVRPAPYYGTLEERIMDAPTNLEDIGILVALTQCIVEHSLIRLDEGKKVLRLPDWFLHENKWRAARYGHDAVLITDADGTEKDLKTIVDELVIELEPIAEKLGNLEELHSLPEFVRRDFAYERQLKIANKLIPNFDQSMFVDDIIPENVGKAIVDYLIAELNAGKAIEVA